MDAKKVQENYNKRLAWVMKMREVLPAVLIEGAKLNAPDPDDVALGGLYWNPNNVNRKDPVRASVSITWGAKGPTDGIRFIVQKHQVTLFTQELADLTKLTETAAAFFRVLIEARST